MPSSSAPTPATDGDLTFQPFCVEARSGPHLTMQAGVMLAGRYWTTTSRRSLKARILRHRPRAAVVLGRPGRPDGATLLSGPVSVLDPMKPWSVLSDPFGGMASGTAVARLSMANLGQLLGYAEGAGKVPGSWLPHHRVLLSLRPANRMVIDGSDVVRAGGAWGDVGDDLAGGGATAPGPPDLSSVPDAHRSLAGTTTEGAWLGLVTPSGPTVIPARWLAQDGAVEVSTDALRRIGFAEGASACLTVDDSDSRRPDEKDGVMLRGSATLIDPDAGAGLSRLALDTERITWWDGFEADTVHAA